MFSAVLLAYGREVFIAECVRLLAEQSVCHVQLVLISSLVELG